jgi:phospholipid N-methyltransferase
LPGVDLIVSGLPWQSFAGPVGGRLIDTIAGCLRRDGVYTQFTYSWNRVGGPGCPTPLSHHRTCGPASGGSSG